MPFAITVHNNFSNFFKNHYTRHKTINVSEKYVPVYLCVLLMPVVVCHVL